MKFYGFYYELFWDEIFILPTIKIRTNNLIYIDNNFSIEFYWLGFHCKWMWVERFKDE